MAAICVGKQANPETEEVEGGWPRWRKLVNTAQAQDMIRAGGGAVEPMFSLFVESLYKGRLPDLDELQQRFNLSLVKKNGVLRLPYHFWQSDPKINPPVVHMLWAAVLLEDQNGMAAVAEFARQETEEANKYRKNRHQSSDASCKVKLAESLDDLLVMVSKTELKTLVEDKCIKARLFLCLK